MLKLPTLEEIKSTNNCSKESKYRNDRLCGWNLESIVRLPPSDYELKHLHGWLIRCEAQHDMYDPPRRSQHATLRLNMQCK